MITKAVRGVGAKWVRQTDRTYDVTRMRDTLKEALTTKEKGPKIIVASSECMLNRQRREKPLVAKAIADGKRVVKPRFGVDEDVCTGDHACMRLSGCPSLSVKMLDDPLRDDPVAAIDQSCVGCGNCGEVADAAVLCPSLLPRRRHPQSEPARPAAGALRAAVTGWLQRRREAKRLVFGSVTALRMSGCRTSPCHPSGARSATRGPEEDGSSAAVGILGSRGLAALGSSPRMTECHSGGR